MAALRSERDGRRCGGRRGSGSVGACGPKPRRSRHREEVTSEFLPLPLGRAGDRSALRTLASLKGIETSLSLLKQSEALYFCRPWRRSRRPSTMRLFRSMSPISVSASILIFMRGFRPGACRIPFCRGHDDTAVSVVIGTAPSGCSRHPNPGRLGWPPYLETDGRRSGRRVPTDLF